MALSRVMISWRRNVEHLLHHVHLGADAVDEGHDEVEAGAQCLGVAAEALDRIIVALRDCLDAGERSTSTRRTRRTNRDDRNH